MSNYYLPLIADCYKTGHISQYPKGTTEIYINFTPRSDEYLQRSSISDGKLYVYGVEKAVKKIKKYFEEFFKNTHDQMLFYSAVCDGILGEEKVRIDQWDKLAEFGSIPLEFKALPEGSLIDVGTPVLTIKNTHPDFFWLPNYIEVLVSMLIWKPFTVANIAREYKMVCDYWCEKTGVEPEFAKIQCHDFSMRGSTGLEDAVETGTAWLEFFKGTDNLLGAYNSIFDAPHGFSSIPASEHSVMCAGGSETEYETYERLITEVYPSGPVSLVSDTWDYWNVLTNILPALKDKIMARDGKLVIRPDSGNPVDIICGTEIVFGETPSEKGSVELLWETFGGTVNEKGYKVLDSHIGLIYGDSITIERQCEILRRLEAKGFASSNIVFGVGSYSLTYLTRDTLGFATKATSAVINGERVSLFKNPKTGSSKKSHKGLLFVRQETDGLFLEQDVSIERERSPENMLRPI